jgi:hypothetical protein
MFGGEDGDASGGPGSSGNARFSMTDINSLFGISDYDNSRIHGGNEYDGDAFSTLAALLLERAGANLKSVNVNANPGNAQSEIRGGGGYNTGNDRPSGGYPTRVPEPNTVVLFGAGMLGVAMLTKRESGPREL